MSANENSNTGINKFVTTHNQLPCLGWITNAMSLGMMSAAARMRYSFSFSPMSALVGTLALSMVVAADISAEAIFLRMLSLAMFELS